MIKTKWNDFWLFRKASTDLAAVEVTLPHDAMLWEKRDPDCRNGKQTGFFPGGRYTYTKRFAFDRNKPLSFCAVEFEAVYRNSRVYLNDQLVGEQPYGYSGFLVNLRDAVRNGENELRVEVDNSGEPNSRWYSGSGIFRDVWLWTAEGDGYIRPHGVKVHTVSASAEEASIRVIVDGEYPENDGWKIQVEVLWNGEIIATETGSDTVLKIAAPRLWSAECPALYTAECKLVHNGEVIDCVRERFGIRTLHWAAGQGFLVNGKKTLLRGACIHHDNGVLGACEYPDAARRRIRILKESGFNAIRSAHNPVSRAILDACDELGMYVMDESFDMWFSHKNRCDYADDFEQWHLKDLAAMVEKDYNHPGVVMYSIGNEVSESVTEQGIAVAEEMVAFLHRIDPSRPVTCGMNIMLNFMSSVGMGIYQEEKEEMSPPKEKKAGSEFINAFIAKTGEMVDTMAKFGFVEKPSEPVFASLDICGYNYASSRYKKDAKQHPERLIVGSETFPPRIVRNWRLVEKLPNVIGDFMWTGWDYIGEAGIGAWSYSDEGRYEKNYPWLLADTGVIDITGFPTAQCYLAQAAWGLLKKPYIGVHPMNRNGETPAKSVWRGTNAVASWTWPGHEGEQAVVEVFSLDDCVELTLNGKSLGKKRLKECKAMFRLPYGPGTLAAVAYDRNGAQTAKSELQTAGAETLLTLTADRTQLQADGESLCFVTLQLTDEKGIPKVAEDRMVELHISGPGTLLGFGSAKACTEEPFTASAHTTSQGRAMAVIRASEKAGTIRICAQASGLEPQVMELSVSACASEKRRHSE